MKKEITIQAPEGYEVDVQQSTFEKIVFKPIEKKAKTWEEIQELNISKGQRKYYINGMGEVTDHVPTQVYLSSNNLPSEHMAEKIIALCKLYIIAEYYNEGWKADYTDREQRKYHAYWSNSEMKLGTNLWYTFSLTTPVFKSQEVLLQAYEANKEIFEKALKP
jgi:hypothetical protein